MPFNSKGEYLGPSQHKKEKTVKDRTYLTLCIFLVVVMSIGMSISFLQNRDKMKHITNCVTKCWESGRPELDCRRICKEAFEQIKF